MDGERYVYSSLTHARTHARTHTRTHARTHTRTHTHIHTAMDAKHGVINEGRNGQEIKEVGKFPPNRRRPVSLEALVVKAIHLNKHSGSSLTPIHVCARECVVDGWVDGCEHVCDTRQKARTCVIWRVS